MMAWHYLLLGFLSGAAIGGVVGLAMLSSAMEGY